MAVVSFRSTLEDNINDYTVLPINNGSFTYTTDEHRLYLDYDGVRNLIAAESTSSGSGDSNYTLSTTVDEDDSNSVVLVFTSAS